MAQDTDSTGLGYSGGAVVFGLGLVIIAMVYFWTNVSRTILFWIAFILTRPLGATVGDFLDKPLDDGGVALSAVCGINYFSHHYCLAHRAVAATCGTTPNLTNHVTKLFGHRCGLPNRCFES